MLFRGRHLGPSIYLRRRSISVGVCLIFRGLSVEFLRNADFFLRCGKIKAFRMPFPVVIGGSGDRITIGLFFVIFWPIVDSFILLFELHNFLINLNRYLF